MKTAIIVAVLIVAAIAAIYFLPAQSEQDKFEGVVLNSEAYADAVQEIASKINELSPTPPTEQTWIVREVEFVKGEPYAYVIYHDTHNIFRILVETGKENISRIAATFEADSQGWRLTGGEDLAKHAETVKITVNN